MKKTTFSIAFILASFWSFGQEELGFENDDQPIGKFRIALAISHTAVPTGEKPEHLFVPSWGLDAEYWVKPTWGIGLHTDMELQTFVVEVSDSRRLEREYPFVATLEILAKPVRGLVIQAGPGYEIEKNENFKLIRFGAEYEFELHNEWDISPTLFYDTRFDAFDTWTIGVCIGKRF